MGVRGQSFLFGAGSHFFDTAASVFDFARQSKRLFFGASPRSFILRSHARQFLGALAGCFRAALSFFNFVRKTISFFCGQLARLFFLDCSLCFGLRAALFCFLLSMLTFNFFFGMLARLFLNPLTSFFNFTR